MMRWVREFRLIPVVLLATASLAALKLLGLLLDGGYLLTDVDVSTYDRPIHLDRDPETGAVAATDNTMPPAVPERTWAKWMVGLPDVTGSVPSYRPVDGDRTGAAGEPAKPAEKPAEKTAEKPAEKPERPPKTPDGKVVDLNRKPQASASERAILDRLSERRQELDQRGREIELRESLLQAAEKKFETHASELRDLEANAGSALAKKEEAEAQRLKNLVTMYENMKAKDAARIFDRLEMRILIEVASGINPRRMSDILGQMSPESAERLTVELANRATAVGDRGADMSTLPKIEGTPRN
jgi:flagellar motility protein MotE (MotC chaperone)